MIQGMAITGGANSTTGSTDAAETAMRTATSMPTCTMIMLALNPSVLGESPGVVAREICSQTTIADQVDVSGIAVHLRDETRWRKNFETEVAVIIAGGSARDRLDTFVRTRIKSFSQARARARASQEPASFSQTNPHPATSRRSCCLASLATIAGQTHSTLLLCQAPLNTDATAILSSSLIPPTMAPAFAELPQPPRIKDSPSGAARRTACRLKAEVHRYASCSLPNTTVTPTRTLGRSCFPIPWRDAAVAVVGLRICSAR
jgi:hypothetical protein